MTMREEVRKIVYEHMISLDSETNARFEQRIDSEVDAIMSLAPLRLAEVAETNKDWKLAVIDYGHWIGFQEETDYAEVVAR
jgi:hypothetical protein